MFHVVKYYFIAENISTSWKHARDYGTVFEPKNTSLSEIVLSNHFILPVVTGSVSSDWWESLFNQLWATW